LLEGDAYTGSVPLRQPKVHCLRQPIDYLVPARGGASRTHRSNRRSKKNVGYGNIYSKTLRTGFFRRRVILWTSAARSCRSSGCDTLPACVASRLAPMKDSSLTWLVGCMRAPCHGGASQLSAANSNARRQLRSVRTLVATNQPLKYRSR
jgi:hypothetical protein